MSDEYWAQSAMKKKSQANIQSWYFITELPLDECMQHLRAWEDLHIKVIVAKSENYPIPFRVDFTPRNKPTIHADGTLERWEGTQTRVQATFQLNSFAKTMVRRSIHYVLFFVTIAPILLCGIVTSFTMLEYKGTTSSMLVVLIFLAIGMIGLMGLFSWCLGTPNQLERQDFTRLRAMLRNYLCEGENSNLQYLVHENVPQNETI